MEAGEIILLSLLYNYQYNDLTVDLKNIKQASRENVEPDALKEWKINIFKIIDTRISFYSRNTHLLPHNLSLIFVILNEVSRIFI